MSLAFRDGILGACEWVADIHVTDYMHVLLTALANYVGKYSLNYP